MTEPTLAHRAISSLIDKLPGDTAMGARLRRADNPATEYMAWEYLVRLGLTLEEAKSRRAFAVVAAALAREKPAKDGEWGIARCLAQSEEQPQGDAASPSSIRFRRLLACDSQEEACRVLRPIIRLVASRLPGRLSYEKLLQDLLYFGPRVKERWAQEYYARPEKKEAGS